MEEQEKTVDENFQLDSIILNNWASKEEDISAPLHVLSLKMDNTKDENIPPAQIPTNNITNWSNPDDTINNSTLLYIAVEYLKNNEIDSSTPVPEQIPQDSFSEFQTPCVSPLDPNMSSAARYSPVQYEQSQNSIAPIVIHRYVSDDHSEPKDFDQNINTQSTLSSEINNVLCSSEENQYLQMINEENNITEAHEMQLMTDGDQQEVELLITDHTTGISYSVNAQDILVESCLENNQQLLDINSTTFNPSLTSLDNDSTLNPETSENLNSTIVTSVNEEAIKNYIDSLSNRSNCEDPCRRLTRNQCKEVIDSVSEEEHLLSRVYSITDKPILSMARASLPESHLLIVKIQEDNAVLAKKLIPKSSQFGPLKGALNLFSEENKNNYKYFMTLKTDSYVIDTSDENNSNWMCFVRHANTYEEQNLIITQEGNGVFFTAMRDIKPKEELKVGYSASYATRYNLPVLKPQQKNERKKWSGFECSEMFGISEELEKHFAMQDEDAKNFKRKYKKTNRIQSDQDVVECNICQRLFAPNISYLTLKKHLVHQHQFVGTDCGEQFTIHKYCQCNVCGMCYKAPALLNIHKLEHDPELPLDHPNHVCPQCQKKFPTRKQLVHHVASHSISRDITKDLKIKCHICHKWFGHSLRLQKHMLCHESNETKPLQCKDCNKRFLTTAGMAVHARGHLKPGENRYECPICRETFDQILHLKNHFPTHAQNNTYSCPVCSRTFQKYSMIRRHMKVHTERKIKCPDCPKIFKTQPFLKKHMLKHSDHKEFLCADCGKQFKRKDKLADHIKKMHMQRTMYGKSSVRLNPRKDGHVKKKANEPKDFHRFIYKCHSCLIGFKRRGMLVNHLAKRHPDVRPNSVPELNLPILQTMKEYQCQYCDKVYKSGTKRKMHILKAHPGAPLPTSSGEKTTARKVTATANPESCQWCHRQYARRSKLLQHIKKAHPALFAGEKEMMFKEKYKKSLSENMDKCSPNPQVESSREVQKSSVVIKSAMDPTFLNQEQNFQNILEKSHATTTDGNITEITPAVIDGLIDDDSKFCHLSIDENEIIQGGQLNSHNARLYRLLTSGNGMMPPR
ncbi:PR domain zinc finger protein 10-like isoform X2 [Anthonomus grandis grandis]|nr:PR domain zinc finger protein 10-like isoform X2 [Anthonomus grandis grandis]